MNTLNEYKSNLSWTNHQTATTMISKSLWWSIDDLKCIDLIYYIWSFIYGTWIFFHGFFRSLSKQQKHGYYARMLCRDNVRAHINNLLYQLPRYVNVHHLAKLLWLVTDFYSLLVALTTTLSRKYAIALECSSFPLHLLKKTWDLK